MLGKLIVIEGTDCSGKETQSNILKENLIKKGYKVFKTYFPLYESPTGKIVGGPYLGKEHISNTWFSEGPTNVDSYVASALYAADRRYALPTINKYLNDGYVVILDRYVFSNMGHQGGKLTTKEERLKLFKKLELLEYEIMELPRPDLTLFIHMPYKYALKLKENRVELPDGHESDQNHLINAEKTYLELAELYQFKTISCVTSNDIKSIDEISEEIYEETMRVLKR